MARTLSSQQSAVFETRRVETPWRVGEDWIDLYNLLGVAEDAHPREIDDAIVGHSAECLQFAFARGGGSEYIGTLQRHLPDFRRVLLHPKQRVRYDELLGLHRAGVPSVSYGEFLDSLPPDTSAAGCVMFVAWLVLGSLTAATWWVKLAQI